MYGVQFEKSSQNSNEILKYLQFHRGGEMATVMLLSIAGRRPLALPAATPSRLWARFLSSSSQQQPPSDPQTASSPRAAGGNDEGSSSSSGERTGPAQGSLLARPDPAATAADQKAIEFHMNLAKLQQSVTGGRQMELAQKGVHADFPTSHPMQPSPRVVAASPNDGDAAAAAAAAAPSPPPPLPSSLSPWDLDSPGFYTEDFIAFFKAEPNSKAADEIVARCEVTAEQAALLRKYFAFPEYETTSELDVIAYDAAVTDPKTEVLGESVGKKTA